MSASEEQLKAALAERARLNAENARYRSILSAHDLLPKPVDEDPVVKPLEVSGCIHNGSPPSEKPQFFKSLFRGREDVYAQRWERGEKHGYAPAAVMDWNAIHAAPPDKRKQVARKTRALRPLTDAAIRDHLEGKATIGIYPLLPDETCRLLAVDFDTSGWHEDATAFLKTCQSFNVPACLERSRSGNGGHIWIFFDRPVPAVDARRLGEESPHGPEPRVGPPTPLALRGAGQVGQALPPNSPRRAHRDRAAPRRRRRPRHRDFGVSVMR